MTWNITPKTYVEAEQKGCQRHHSGPNMPCSTARDTVERCPLDGIRMKGFSVIQLGGPENRH